MISLGLEYLYVLELLCKLFHYLLDIFVYLDHNSRSTWISSESLCCFISTRTRTFPWIFLTNSVARMVCCVTLQHVLRQSTSPEKTAQLPRQILSVLYLSQQRHVHVRPGSCGNNPIQCPYQRCLVF